MNDLEIESIDARRGIGRKNAQPDDLRILFL
jgi:hypothetical protein